VMCIWFIFRCERQSCKCFWLFWKF